MWLHQNKNINSIEDLPKDAIGFIYEIENLTNGRFYIGKKLLKTRKTRKIGKKELLRIKSPGRRPRKISTLNESDWLSYFGSCKPLLEDIQSIGKDKFKREIIMICYSKKQLSYYEMYYQVINDVLNPTSNSYNGNIMGKYFPTDLLASKD